MEELSARADAISKNVRDLREDITRDHGEVLARLDRIDDRLGSKVDYGWVKEIHDRTDALERARDKFSGGVRALVAINALAILVVGVLGVLAATGNL